MKLFIQIPCYNEAETLHFAINDLPKLPIDGIDEIKLLIINDGSKDETVQRARELGVDYIVSFKQNKGLAAGFMAGIAACLSLGADIIVNTDADNQYCGDDIRKLIAPIVAGKADIVVGERPIDDTEHFSWKKKKLQHFGSWVVKKASHLSIPDAPSGFRAYSREAAMRLNVVNEYTYTLETLIQSGMNKTAIISVPIRTNPELRESRLFRSMYGYIERSAGVIIRSYMMYRPLSFFFVLSAIIFSLGVGLGIRFLLLGEGGHIQSLILAAILILLGSSVFFIGLQADLIAANRKILEEIQYHVRRASFDNDKEYFNVIKGEDESKIPLRAHKGE